MQSHSNAEGLQVAACEALSNIAYGSPLGRSLGFFTGDDMCAPELQHETLSFATYETLLNRVQHGIAGAKAGAWHYPGRFGLIRHFVSESVLIILVWLKKCTKTKEDQGSTQTGTESETKSESTSNRNRERTRPLHRKAYW